MLYVTKMLKNTSEDVEGKNENTNAVMKADSSLDLNQSLEEMDPELNLALNSTYATKLNSSGASEPLHGRHVIHLEEQEYSCNYCPKKFTSKQALGGHQNAHKIERVIERHEWHGHETHFGYTGNHSVTGMTSFHFPSSFNQAPGEPISHSMMHSPHYHHQSMQYKMYTNDYTGFMFPMSQESHAVQPFPQPSSFCTSPTRPPFMPFHSSMGQSSNSWKGKSIAGANNDQAEHYCQSNNSESQHLEDVALDLSLKL